MRSSKAEVEQNSPKKALAGHHENTRPTLKGAEASNKSTHVCLSLEKELKVNH